MKKQQYKWPDSLREKRARAASLLVGAAAGLSLLALASCNASTPPGPIFSSFGANSYEITEGQTIRITAALSDVDGGPVKVGVKGVLSDGATKVYGPFVTSMPGIYTYDISWTQLNQDKGIAFAAEEMRSYTAEFSDDYGNRMTREFTLRLHCGGDPACEGHCVKLGAACPVSTTLQCLSGQCGLGCIIGNRGYLDKALNPDNPCQSCNMLKSKSSFVTSPPYTACAAGLSCSATGQCTEPFRLRESSAFAIDQIIAPAPDVRLAVANKTYGSSQNAYATAFTSTDKLTSTPSPGIIRLLAIDANNILRQTTSGLELSVNGGRGFSPIVSISGYPDASWASSKNDIWYSTSGNPPINTYAHYHSTNGGATFSRVTGVKFPLDQIFGTSPNNVFFVARQGGLYRTNDQGATFTDLGHAGFITVIWGTGPSDLYVGTNVGLYHSTDNGVTLNAVTAPAGSQSPAAPVVGIHGCGPTDVFIANTSEIWHSTDGQKATLVTRYDFNSAYPDYGWHSVACTAPGKMVAGGSADGLALVIESL